MPGKRAPNRVPFTIILEKSLLEELRGYAKQEDLSVSRCAAILIKEGLSDAKDFKKAMKSPAFRQMAMDIAKNPVVVPLIQKTISDMEPDQLLRQMNLLDELPPSRPHEKGKNEQSGRAKPK